MKVIDNDLIVGGVFDAINRSTSSALVCWNGEQWRDVAAPANARISAVSTDGNELVIGGAVTGSLMPLLASRPLAAGGSWTSLLFDLHTANGVTAELHDVVFHNGSLYAAGRFAASSTQITSIARLDGTTWTQLQNATGYGYQLISFQGELLAGGAIGVPVPFSRTGGAGGVMRMTSDDNRLEPLGGGVAGHAHVLLPFRGSILAFGTFPAAGHSAVQNAGQWTGREWRPLGTGVGHPVSSIATWNGRAVVGGGHFVSVEIPGGWQTVGDPFHRTSTIDGPVMTVASVGETLFVAGTTCTGPLVNRSCPFGVLRWSGLAWEPLPGTAVTFSQVSVLHDYHGNLIAAGPFITNTNPPLAGVARWNGAAWHALGSGIGGPPTGTGVASAPDVQTAITFHGDLIVAGTFTTADGQPARNIARWDGTAWHAMGNGLPERVDGLTILNDQLYASVRYTGLLRWTNTSWELVVGDHRGGRLVTHQGEIVRASAYHGQTAILRGGIWRTIDHVGGISPAAIASINGEVLMGTTEVSRYEDGERVGYLTRWSAGGDAPTHYTVTAPSTISIRRGGPFSMQVLEFQEPTLGVQLVHDGIVLPTDTTTDGSPWLGRDWNTGSDRRMGLNIRNAQPEHAGEYRFQLSNPCGTVQTEPFRVTIRCGGDFDGDNAVTTADLFAFFQAYFSFEFDAQHGAFNGTEELSVADLFAFLTDYLTPCP